MYTHIVFDIDGTLLDTERSDLESLQETMKTLFGRDIPLEELTFAFGITGADALARMGVENIPAALEVWNRNIRARAHMVKLFPGIAETVEALSAAGRSLGAVTSRTREEYAQDLCRLTFSPLLQLVICAEDTAAHKPDPAPLRQYLALSGARAGETLYVGDSVYDSRCAQGAGIDFALAAWGSKGRDVPAKYILKTPEDLLDVCR